MATYLITFEAEVTITVDADDRDSAVEKARIEFSKRDVLLTYVMDIDKLVDDEDE